MSNTNLVGLFACPADRSVGPRPPARPTARESDHGGLTAQCMCSFCVACACTFVLALVCAKATCTSWIVNNISANNVVAAFACPTVRSDESSGG